MGDEQHGHAPLRLLGEQEVGDLPARFGIEIARRFISDQHERRRRQRPRNGDTLLLAAGQLPGIMVETFSEPHRCEFAPCDIEGIAHIRQLQRNGDVFERGHVGDQMEGLEDDADIAAAEIGKRIFGERMEWLAGNVDFALVQTLQTGEDHQKRRFSGSGRADNADGFSPADLKVDLFQHMHGSCCASEGEIRLLQLDNGFSQNKASYIGFSEQRKPPGGSSQSRERTVSFKASLFHFVVMSILLTGSILFCGPAAAQQQAIQLVGFGDSLMAGYHLTPSESYAAQLEAALKAKGHNVVVTNAGVSGDTTSSGLARIDWSVPDGTDGVILELGANDALRGIAPEQTQANLDAMLSRLKERGIAVLLVGIMAPPNMGGDYAERFNGIYARLAEKHGVALYPFFLDGVVTVEGTQLEDGMHPNARGVGIMVERSLPAVEMFLGDIPAAGK